MGTFAGKPEDMGARYCAVAEAARMHELPDKDKLRYLTDMISEEEILDMREATLEEGRAEQRLEDAKGMLKHGVEIHTISDITGLSF